MDKRLWVVGGLALALAGCSRGTDANSVLQDAQMAMGNPDSIQYSGTGMSARFPLSFAAGGEWPRRELSSYTRAINYAQRSSSEEWTFYPGQYLGSAGKQSQQVNGDKAWMVTPAGLDAYGNRGAPQLEAADVFQLGIWLTPHGFLKAAMAASDATLSRITPPIPGMANVISFTALGKYPVSGTIDTNNLVTRVETAIGNSGASAPGGVLGDMEVTASYSGYRDFGGIQFPTRIQATQGGYPLWEFDVTTVTPNAPFDLPVPEAIQAAKLPPPPSMGYGYEPVSAKLADGVWHVAGGLSHSVIVEFADYVAVVEAQMNDRRTMAVLAEAKKLAPNKPVRYVLTSHHHFDHLGGLRAYVAQGVNVVTHQYNVRFLERVLTLPSTLAPDMLTKNPQPPKVQGVLDKFVMTDGQQTMEVYATNGDAHVNESLFMYLPGPRILVEDAYNPEPPDAPPPATPPAAAVVLYEAIQRLKLNVATIAPMHGIVVPMSELRRWIGLN